jgi:sigma-E factor negative regulatory protein RseA
MSHEELESQLSAMFDDELPAPECELLARRLARDDALKGRWSRYAAIGAVIRMEPGASEGRLAGRVSTLIASEPSLLVGARRPASQASASPLRRWWQPAAGAAVAAGVAAVAVFLLRSGISAAPLVARSGTPASVAGSGVSAGSAVTVPAASEGYAMSPTVESASFAPSLELADFVVAHSEFSMPFLRRSALSALVAAESAGEVSAASAMDASNDDSADPGIQHAAQSH